LFPTSCALLGVALLLSACGDSSHGDATPPTVAPVKDLTGIGIAVYAPPAAYKGALSDDTLSADATKSVAVYGDSLTAQAWDYVINLAMYGGLQLLGNRLSGTALCDWRDDMIRVMTTARPPYLVFGFAGNNGTPCTHQQVGDALGAIYEEDARAVVQQAEQVGTHVVLVGPPDMGLPFVERNAGAVRAAFQRVADEAGDDVATFVDSRDEISPDGFDPLADCKSWENATQGCRDGRIRIRLPDGVHWSQPNIYGYSGGSWRWATILFEKIQPAPNSAATRD
jgi:hypothetical protein